MRTSEVMEVLSDCAALIKMDITGDVPHLGSVERANTDDAKTSRGSYLDWNAS